MKNDKKIPQDQSDVVALELRRLGVTLDDVKHQGLLTAEMVGHLTVNMQIVKEDIEFIKSGFKKKVDAEEFAALARRVSILERRR
ncbi:MAG: hypothetical protein Q7S49_01010 [bacterium]|nr:hypothetical protein [bacterium]